MPFGLVFQKCRRFRLAVKSSVFDMQQKNHRSFVAVILKVLLVNLFAVLKFANIF